MFGRLIRQPGVGRRLAAADCVHGFGLGRLASDRDRIIGRAPPATAPPAVLVHPRSSDRRSSWRRLHDRSPVPAPPPSLARHVPAAAGRFAADQKGTYLPLAASPMPTRRATAPAPGRCTGSRNCTRCGRKVSPTPKIFRRFLVNRLEFPSEKNSADVYAHT